MTPLIAKDIYAMRPIVLDIYRFITARYGYFNHVLILLTE